MASSNFDSIVDEACAYILNKIDGFQQKGSGWIVTNVGHLDLRIARFKPLRGSTYVPLPKYIRDKKAVINVKNKDNRCLMWAVLAGLHPANRDAERPTKYKEF